MRVVAVSLERVVSDGDTAFDIRSRIYLNASSANGRQPANPQRSAKGLSLTCISAYALTKIFIVPSGKFVAAQFVNSAFVVPLLEYGTRGPAPLMTLQGLSGSLKQLVFGR